MSDELSIQILQSPGHLGNPAERLQWLEQQFESTVDENVQLLILPELFQSGYYIGEPLLQFAESSDGAFAQEIIRLAKANSTAIVYGYAEKHEGMYYNSAQCIDNSGSIIGHHRKLMLPPGFETTLFSSGSECQLFKLDNFTVALLICYDVEFPENVRHAAVNGADLVVVPTALGENWGVVSQAVVPARAFENGVYLAYANHCGSENKLTYFGGSCIIGPDGVENARAKKDIAVIGATLSKAKVVAAQKRLPYLTERSKLPWA